MSCYNNLVAVRLLVNQVKHHFQRPVVAVFRSCHSVKTETIMQDISDFLIV